MRTGRSGSRWRGRRSEGLSVALLCLLAVCLVVRSETLESLESETEKLFQQEIAAKMKCEKIIDFPASSEEVYRLVASSLKAHGEGVTRFQSDGRLKRNIDLTETTEDVEVIKVGVSGQGKDILAFLKTYKLFIGRNHERDRAGTQREKEETKQKVERQVVNIALFGGMHAREWITVATLTCLANQLKSELMTQVVSELLRQQEVFLSSEEAVEVRIFYLPVVNPDGYDLTQRHQKQPNFRHWRKTYPEHQHPKTFSKCVGTDLNRNFGYKNISWGFGLSHGKCSELYQGELPFSAPEARALRDFMLNVFLNRTKKDVDVNRKTKLFESFWVLDVHCCAKTVLSALEIRFDENKTTSSLKPLHQEMGDRLAFGLNHFSMMDATSRYKYRPRERTFSKSNTGIFVDWVQSLESEVAPSSLKAFIIELRGRREARDFKQLFKNNKEDIPIVSQELLGAVAAVLMEHHQLHRRHEADNDLRAVLDLSTAKSVNHSSTAATEFSQVMGTPGNPGCSSDQALIISLAKLYAVTLLSLILVRCWRYANRTSLKTNCR